MSPLNLGRGSVYEYHGAQSSSGNQRPRSQSQQSTPHNNLGPHGSSITRAPGHIESASSLGHGHNNLLEPSSGYGNNLGQPPASHTSQNNSRMNGPVDIEGNNHQDSMVETAQPEYTEQPSFWTSRRGAITATAILFVVIIAAVVGGVCGSLLKNNQS